MHSQRFYFLFIFYYFFFFNIYIYIYFFFFFFFFFNYYYTIINPRARNPMDISRRTTCVFAKDGLGSPRYEADYDKY